MFGSAPPPQNEGTPFHPRSPYGCAKVFGYWATVNYREAYGMYAVNGILFNHESPRRGETFVTRKITRAVARIKAGLQDRLYLGNLDAVRDWGYAPEYVDAMWRMLQRDEPEDYVVATGEAATVRQFVEVAFAHADLDWAEHVRYDPKYERPSEVDALIGDASKARDLLGWKAQVTVAELARIMVDADIRQVTDQLAGATVRIDRSTPQAVLLRPSTAPEHTPQGGEPHMRNWPVLTAALALAAATLGVVGSPSATALQPPVGITADNLSTYQTNGVVWAMAQAGGLVFVGGTFSSIRPPGAAAGTDETQVANFAAFDAATGAAGRLPAQLHRRLRRRHRAGARRLAGRQDPVRRRLLRVGQRHRGEQPGRDRHRQLPGEHRLPAVRSPRRCAPSHPPPTPCTSAATSPRWTARPATGTRRSPAATARCCRGRPTPTTRGGHWPSPRTARTPSWAATSTPSTGSARTRWPSWTPRPARW